MKLFTGSSNPALAEKIANYIGAPLGEIDITRFPDGEIFAKVKENIRGKDVFVLQ
ncbi:MAG: ribose-phosphate pyrophosphokinase-like domain-containing protein, partial [Verrucomicrobia bacterium]|nr:ribose-phosphate pyrophosphokinase-like domain-containing protein [Verrucomicrobiota bacterium]